MKSLPVFAASIMLAFSMWGCGSDDSLTYISTDPATVPGANVPTTSIPKTNIDSCLALSSSMGANGTTTDSTLNTQKNSCITYLNSLVTSIKADEAYLESHYDLEFVTEYNMTYINGNLFDESYESQSNFSTTKTKLTALNNKLSSFPTTMPIYMQDQTDFVAYFSTNNAKKTSTDNLIKFMEDCPYHEQYCNDNVCQCAYMMPMY